MTISSESAKDLARLGCDITITEGAKYSSESVKDIARIMVQKGTRLTVHAGGYSSESLKDIVRIGGANVTIAI
jgi:phosphotransferase system HPr-like phosphotransfer protein